MSEDFKMMEIEIFDLEMKLQKIHKIVEVIFEEYISIGAFFEIEGELKTIKELSK